MAAEVRRSAEGLELTLTGEWGVREFDTLEAQLAAVDVQSAHRVRVDAQPLTKLDLAGAWALHQFIARARGRRRGELPGRSARAAAPPR